MIRKNTIWLTYTAGALILIGLSTAVFFGQSFPIDTTVLRGVRSLESPIMDRLMLGITRFGDPLFTVPLFFVLLALLWLKKHRLAAYVFALNCAGGAVFSTGLKLFFGKERPTLWTSAITEVSYSYPSGHALGSVVLYGFLAFLLGQRLPEYKGVIYFGAIALSLAIGFSRLYLGVHWPTDLVGGYIIGFLWTSSCTRLLKRLRQRQRQNR